jgi:hypothetical protein
MMLVSADQLAILPGLTHYIVSSPMLPTVVTPFLDSPMPAPNRSQRVN